MFELEEVASDNKRSLRLSQDGHRGVHRISTSSSLSTNSKAASYCRQTSTADVFNGGLPQLNQISHHRPQHHRLLDKQTSTRWQFIRSASMPNYESLPEKLRPENFVSVGDLLKKKRESRVTCSESDDLIREPQSIKRKNFGRLVSMYDDRTKRGTGLGPTPMHVIQGIAPSRKSRSFGLKRRTTRSSKQHLEDEDEMDKHVTPMNANSDMLSKFRHAVRMVLILRKWSFEIEKTIDANRLLGKYSTFTDLATEVSDEVQNEKNDFGFDATFYKAKKVLTLSNEVKEILALPPKLRTPEQVTTIIYGIRNHPSFAEYPHHMQEKLCQVARYEKVPAKRVIIRQGHYAQNFYFIISGQAIVKVMETNPVTGEETVRTAAILKDGSSFGEIALLHEVRRTATVVSRDVMHLLTIGREDFFDIFMGEINATSGYPVHIKFLMSMAFMKGWPIEKLVKHKDYCIMHYYKKGEVVVEDSKRCDWIYVVKSGTCSVIKHIREALPDRLWRKEIKLGRSNCFPQLGTSEQSPRVDNGRRHVGISHIRRPTTSVMSDTFAESSVSRSAESALNIPTPHRHETFSSLPPIGSHCMTSSTAVTSSSSLVTTSMTTSPPIHQSHVTPSLRGSSVHSTGSGNHTRGEPMPPGFSPSKLNLIPSWRNSETLRKSLLFDKDGVSSVDNYKREYNTNQSPSDIHREVDFYLQVHVLKTGDTFGLADLKFGDHVDAEGPSMSLVSESAEIIMLRKQFFILNADEEVKEHLRRNMQEYPDDGAIRSNLKIKLNWDTYRRQVIKSLLNKQHDLHLLKKRTSVTGIC